MSGRPDRIVGMSRATIPGGRFVLRLLDATDPAHLVLYRALYTCPEVMRRIMPPLTREAAEAAFGRACGHNLRTSPGHRVWAIEAAGSGEGVGLTALQCHGVRGEFGVMIASNAWNRGISGEALRAVLAYAFDDRGLVFVEATSLDDECLPVIERLLAPAGFQRSNAAVSGMSKWKLARIRWRQEAGAEPAVGFQVR